MDSKSGEKSEEGERICEYLSNGPRTPELVIVSDESKDGPLLPVSSPGEKQAESLETQLNSTNKASAAGLNSANPTSAQSTPSDPHSAQLNCNLQLGEIQAKQKPVSRALTISALNRIVQTYRKTKYKEKPAQKQAAERLVLPKVTEPGNSSNIITNSATPATSTINGLQCGVMSTSGSSTVNMVSCAVTNSKRAPLLNGIPSSVSSTSGVPCNAQVVITVPKSDVSDQNNYIQMPVTLGNTPRNISQPNMHPPITTNSGKISTSVRQDTNSLTSPNSLLNNNLCSESFVPSLQDNESIGAPNLNTETNFQKTINHIAYLKSLNKQDNQHKLTASSSPSETRPGSASYPSPGIISPSIPPYSSEKAGRQEILRHLSEMSTTDLNNTSINPPLSCPATDLNSENNRNIRNHDMRIKNMNENQVNQQQRAEIPETGLPHNANLPLDTSRPHLSRINNGVYRQTVSLDSDSDEELPRVGNALSGTSKTCTSNLNSAVSHDKALPNSTAQHPCADFSRTSPYRQALPTAMITNSTNVPDRRFFPQNMAYDGNRENQLPSRYLEERMQMSRSNFSKTAPPVNPALALAPNVSHPLRYMNTANRRMFPQNLAFHSYQQERNLPQNMHGGDRAASNVSGSAFHIPTLPPATAMPYLTSNANIINHETFLQSMMPYSDNYGNNCQLNQFLQGTTEAANMNFGQNASVSPVSPVSTPNTYTKNNGNTLNQRIHSQNILPTFGAYGNHQLPVAVSQPYTSNNLSCNMPPENTAPSTAKRKVGRPRKRTKATESGPSTESEPVRKQNKKRVQKYKNPEFTGSEVNTPGMYPPNSVGASLGYAGNYQMASSYTYVRNENPNRFNNYNFVPNYFVNNPSVNRPVNSHVAGINAPFNNSYLSQINCQSPYPNAYNNVHACAVDNYNYRNHVNFNSSFTGANCNELCPPSSISPSRSFPAGATNFLPSNQMNVAGQAGFQNSHLSNPQDMNQNHFQNPNMYTLGAQLFVKNDKANGLPSYHQTFGVSGRGNQSVGNNNDFGENSCLINSEGKFPAQETEQQSHDAPSNTHWPLENNDKEFPDINHQTPKDASICHLPDEASSKTQEKMLKRLSLLAFIDYIPEDDMNLVTNSAFLNSSGLENNANRKSETPPRTNVPNNRISANAAAGGGISQEQVVQNNSSTNDFQMNANQNQSNGNVNPKLNEQSGIDLLESMLLEKANGGSCLEQSEDLNLILENSPPKKKIRLGKVDENPKDSTVRAKMAYDEMRFLDFFHVVRHNIFPVLDHEKLRDMWNKAQLFHYQNSTGLPVTAQARFKILEQNPAPPSIQGTYGITPSLGFQV